MIKRLLTHTSRLFIKKQETILSAAAVIMATVLFSRVLGLFRDRLLASYFSPDELGIYFAAFRLPNLLFELLVMGALSTAFIPVFTQYLVDKSEREAFRLASQVMNLTVIGMMLLAGVLFIFAKPLSYILVPAFSDSERELMVSFTRIMLVGQLLPLVIGNFLTGILQSMQRFLVAAVAPILYNLGIVLGTIFFSSWGLYGPVWGVVMGAILFLLVQLPLILRLNYRHDFTLTTTHPGVRKVLKLMLPRTFGMAVSQIDTTVDLILASFLGTRYITIFYLAQHLQQLPVGLFGTTFAQAALPTFSQALTKKDTDSFKKLFLASLHQVLFFVLPASIMLVVLRTPIVRLVFGARRFDWEATVLTGQTLSFFAVSIFAQSIVQIVARAYYAFEDTKTPVIIGVISVVINTILSIWFIKFLHLPVWSLAVSTSIASLVNGCVLFVLLYIKIGGLPTKQLLLPPFKMGIASLITGISIYVPLKLFDQLVFDTTRVFHLLLLTGIASITGLAMYLFLAWFLEIEEVNTFIKLISKIKRMPRLLTSQSEELVHEDPTRLV